MKNSCSFDPPSVKKAGNSLEPYSNSDLTNFVSCRLGV